MGILGIRNRTEDWRTAQYFMPLRMEDGVGTFASRLSGTFERQSNRATLELFWTGMRDYVWETVRDKGRHGKDKIGEAVAVIYDDLFTTLRSDIQRFDGVLPLRDHNYDTSTKERRSKLFNNLLGTEVDIAIEDTQHLYLGEAKYVMDFGTNGKLVLVHQLVRQYVMANILVELSGHSTRKRVVPFVVGDDVEHLKKTDQVRFMMSQGWLQERNILSWDNVAG